MSSINSADSLGTIQWDMLELAGHLRLERLFVNSEKQNLKELNRKVLYISSDLAQQAWITDQQRVNLNRLIVARADCTPASCCQRANTLENCHFVDAYKHLRHQACSSYGEFLDNIRKSPELIASCLVEADRISPETVQNIIQSLSAGLYGSCLMPEDKLFVLKLLRQLMYLQIIPSDNPRRLLRHGTCAFSRFYSVFHENLFSAKLYLTAALHNPITQLLMEDEKFLDIDPDKASIRFPPSEKLKRFGKEGTQEYHNKLQKYRLWTINSLVRITQRFITSIRDNIHCFPTSICWIVRQMANLLSKNNNIEPKEIHAMCTDLVFTYFICPAIVNPEPYGITDAPISYIARFNLMQVGQILQMLSLMKYQTVDQKVIDLYKRFDKDSISSIIDAMLDGTNDEQLDDEPSIIDNTKLQGLCRSAALLTENELNSLVNFFHVINNNNNDDDDANDNDDESNNDDASNDDDDDDDVDEQLDNNNNLLNRKKLNELLSQLPAGSVSSNKIIINNNNSNSNNNTSPETPSKRGGLLRKVSRGRGSRVSSSSSSSVPDGAEDNNNNINNSSSGSTGGTSCGNDDDFIDKKIPQDVLVIPFSPTIGESVGLLSEQKVLCMDIKNNIDNSNQVTLTLPKNIQIINNQQQQDRQLIVNDRIETQEKRTRFSLSHDEILFEGSIGNTSDNLEAVSEAASNHSVASSLELETEDQNDNLSDMVSANVSGRGSPNISGRDTPSSQLTEGGDDNRVVVGGIDVRQHDLPTPTIAEKQSRSEIDDKFCKFEIKKLIEGDETISLVSDTWSTDVLGSDSEFIEVQDRYQYSQPSVLQVVDINNCLIDINETASDAWSTDVLASDSERLTEVDTDDTSSVARSDDTARSEIESRGEPEGSGASASGSGINCNNINYLQETRNLPIGTIVDGAGMLFRTIREEPIGRSSIITIPSSPTASASSTSSANVTGRGGTRSDYQRSTMEYVDNNSNGISDNTDYTNKKDAATGTSRATRVNDNNNVIDDGISNLIDKLQIDNNNKSNFSNGNQLITTNTTTITTTTTTTNTTTATNLSLTNKNHTTTKNDDVDNANDVIVRLSTASLTSSSSFGSDTKIKNTTTTSMTSTTPERQRPITNGSNDITNNSNNNNTILLSSSSSTTNKPSISSGAIPKSISFDMTATRGDKELLDDDQKNKRGFFSKFKMSLKNRRGKSPRGISDDLIGNRCYDNNNNNDNNNDINRHRLRRIMSEDTTATSSSSTTSMNNFNDSTDDILAKYRRKPSVTSDTASVESNQSRTKEAEDERLMIDQNNIELSFAFNDAKRKLRMVLSTADLQQIPWFISNERNNIIQKDNELITFLQLQLSEAINLQDRPLIARLHETLRCVRLFNDEGCKKLFLSLKDDYQKRSPYIAYLIRCKQGLLSTLAHLERLGERVKCDRDAVNSHLVALCVHVYLEKRENQILKFCDEFQKLEVSDEKQDFVDNFLLKINSDMEIDAIWQSASDGQLELARMVVERTVMARIYQYALYPNGDGDVNRDQLLYDHIKKLSKIVTPNHKDLKITKIYHYECPWPSAQAELAVISAYKTPRDKLQCVFRCATTIMNLLSMASERRTPAADDLMPVLVYVIIKTNPPSLLSTVQYVDSFYGNRLEGEEQYWWTQFYSAIEFIKTMD
ncbi:hypothetical protein HCN44_009452 [Aphidius gifuensis]|uniref:Receptor-mediated endocytosis protein 6 homolog n=1 Tax=Aphidius gifuensis TaxID=684658 RepID=A0A835CVG0_APHGI|nr:GTPase-activating protein and VPS9 domain-containing protein 1 [Aphidius gifuensis]KAF7998054.1 hypothetical protein HCN44_009452 [Aphidius gifuensis]